MQTNLLFIGFVFLYNHMLETCWSLKDIFKFIQEYKRPYVSRTWELHIKHKNSKKFLIKLHEKSRFPWCCSKKLQSSFYSNQRLSRVCIVHLVIKKNNWSYVKTMSCSGSHLGITINIKNTNFVKDHPMNIHVQFGFNNICSFWEEGIWTFSHRVQC